MIKRISFCLAILLFMSVCFSAQAKTTIVCDYTMEPSSGAKIPIPLTHEYRSTISYIEGYQPANGYEGMLKNAQDIVLDQDNNIYIADTDNNAVLKLDNNGKLLTVVTQADGLDISKPLGVYVDADGDMFIADNGNQRIVHTDTNGNFIESFVAPDSELLSRNLTVFDPAKIAINTYNGYLYMIIGKEFITLDASNRFQGLVGTVPVGFDLLDFIVRTFATEKQKTQLSKREPLPYNNFCITPDNKIYAVSNENSNQIKRINAAGDSTYPTGFYGEISYEDTKTIYPLFSDIAVNSYGMITVADQRSSKLYQYDSEGNLLAVFGGRGDNKGRFQTISSIAYDSEDRLYVLDSTTNTIHVLEPTAFLAQIHQAISQFLSGRYTESMTSWNAMRQHVTSYPLAQKKVSEILLKQERYAEAMQEYRNAGDKQGYAQAWQKVRERAYAENFLVIGLAVIALVAGFLYLLIYLHRRGLVYEDQFYASTPGKAKEAWGLSIMMIFHPIRAYTLVKRTRDRKNWIPVFVLPALFFITKLLSSVGMAFQVSQRSLDKVSLPLELATSVVPILILAACIYGITSVMSGEMTLYETLASMGYSLVPAMLFLPVLTAVSYFVASNELSIFHSAHIMVYIWIGINIFLAVYHLNETRVSSAVGLCILSVLSVAVVLILLLLLVVFSSQLGHFFISVYEEISGRLY